MTGFERQRKINNLMLQINEAKNVMILVKDKLEELNSITAAGKLDELIWKLESYQNQNSKLIMKED